MRKLKANRMDKLTKNGKLFGYDLNLIIVVTVSTLVLILERYYPVPLDFPQITELVYYLVIPLVIGFLVFRDKPPDYGMRFGNWKFSLVAIVVSLAVAAALIYAVSGLPDFRSYYRVSRIDWGELLLHKALYMFAWEFIFRGYMLFGLEKSIGKSAIFIQAIPFVLLHIGKPALETFSCIPSGFIFGWISYRTRSFLPCFIIHFGIYVMIVVFTNY